MYFILKMSTCLLVTIGLFIYHKLCSFLVLIFVMKTAILDILALLLDTVNNWYVVKLKGSVFMFWPFYSTPGSLLSKDKGGKFE